MRSGESAVSPPRATRTRHIGNEGHAEEVPAPRLSDGVVILDAFKLHDVSAQLAGEDEEHARRFGWYPAHSTKETVQAAVHRWQEEWRLGGGTRALAARDARNGELIGGCEIRLRNDAVAEMSYWVFPSHRGRGFASRIVRLTCDYAFSDLAVARMELYIEPDNLASRGVAQNAGFVEEGVLRSQGVTTSGERRDMVLYSRLPSD
jgi:RimJ/RimL family protein N-acetyltransferase